MRGVGADLGGGDGARNAVAEERNVVAIPQERAVYQRTVNQVAGHEATVVECGGSDGVAGIARDFLEFQVFIGEPGAGNRVEHRDITVGVDEQLATIVDGQDFGAVRPEVSELPHAAVPKNGLVAQAAHNVAVVVDAVGVELIRSNRDKAV